MILRSQIPTHLHRVGYYLGSFPLFAHSGCFVGLVSFFCCSTSRFSCFFNFVVFHFCCLVLQIFCSSAFSCVFCFTLSLFYTFVELYFRCFALLLFRIIAVAHFRCCSLSLLLTFVISYLCFARSIYFVLLLFCTFVLSQFFVSHVYCFLLLFFITFLFCTFSFHVLCSWVLSSPIIYVPWSYALRSFCFPIPPPPPNTFYPPVFVRCFLLYVCCLALLIFPSNLPMFPDPYVPMSYVPRYFYSTFLCSLVSICSPIWPTCVPSPSVSYFRCFVRSLICTFVRHSS